MILGLPPNHSPPLLYSRPHLINHLGKNITSLGYLGQEILPWSTSRVTFIQELVKLAFFLSLSKQFFTGNKTGRLQMTSTNDTQGSFVLLLSLLKDNSILNQFLQGCDIFLAFSNVLDLFTPIQFLTAWKTAGKVSHHWVKRRHNTTLCNMNMRVHHFTFSKKLVSWFKYTTGNEEMNHLTFSSCFSDFCSFFSKITLSYNT